MLAERVVGQRIKLTANPNYWRQGEPVTKDVVITIFSQDAVGDGSARIRRRRRDLWRHPAQRRAAEACRLPTLHGPGPLVQVFRINSTRGPFKNAKFRQAFNYLMDREAILRAGYAGVGRSSPSPGRRSSPAYDASYNEDLRASTSTRRRNCWPNRASPRPSRATGSSSSMPATSRRVAISQVVQSTLTAGGHQHRSRHEGRLRVRRDHAAGQASTPIFGGVGNIQKFPSRAGHEQHLPHRQQPGARNAASPSRNMSRPSRR